MPYLLFYSCFIRSEYLCSEVHTAPLAKRMSMITYIRYGTMLRSRAIPYARYVVPRNIFCRTCFHTTEACPGTATYTFQNSFSRTSPLARFRHRKCALPGVPRWTFRLGSLLSYPVSIVPLTKTTTYLHSLYCHECLDAECQPPYNISCPARILSLIKTTRSLAV